MPLQGNTTPIINIVQSEEKLRKQWVDEYMKLHSYCRNFTRNYVEFHKSKFGRQLICFNGGYHRYWVWEGSVVINEHHIAKWRIFVSNNQGINFEVDTGKADAAMACWDDYKTKIGM